MSVTKPKKEVKGKKITNGAGSGEESSTLNFETVSSKAELKIVLLNIRDKMEEEVAAPIYALSAMNHLMTLPDIYSWLDNENKEIARDIWLRLKQSGLQLRNPPLLFAPDEFGSEKGALGA